ncbi:MotE family protein [Pelosinus sp. sgz500959]|uniref:MotE family protein n=1 Tax=Pelosinus sp. sgz500959 TaxID=3242472 RepID=UPI003670846F
MADKIKNNTKTKKNDAESEKVEKPKKKSGRILKVILILIILLILAATGFAAGIYLKFINVQDLVEKWKLDQYPVIGQYFSQPKTNFEPVEVESQNPLTVPQNLVVPTVANPVLQPEEVVPEKKKIDDTELQKQAKIKQQEEAKRISKLSRLYGTMKPDEAAAILNQMDDETVLVILSKMEDEQVAKILALFDAKRAAILSQSMLRGNNTN